MADDSLLGPDRRGEKSEQRHAGKLERDVALLRLEGVRVGQTGLYITLFEAEAEVKQIAASHGL